MKIKVGARGSKLSQRQVEEIMGGLGREYECGWVETMGDRDLISSLVQMDKTNFFTREIDEKVLGGNAMWGFIQQKICQSLFQRDSNLSL
jgi:hydroxymethylbilane synthase